MPNEQPQPDAWWKRPLIRRLDQVTVAVLISVALILMAIHWLQRGGLGGAAIEIERAEKQSVTFRLDINQADWPELSLLPNVGEKLARRIVESRTTDGPFRNLRDLERVRGIGRATIELMEPHLTPFPPRDPVAER